MSDNSAYWKANVSLLIKCLVVWFLVSYVCGIALVEQLNQIRLGGFKLGFWFAQQGSIYFFLIIIFYYAKRMAEIDREHGVNE
ncbi:MAG: DUF4212 domain-containing protein [Gammaproteobacteria bacterium]|nr:DUF4212 domain-containing protein [Gammaproteobacteria bacterium]